MVRVRSAAYVFCLFFSCSPNYNHVSITCRYLTLINCRTLLQKVNVNATKSVFQKDEMVTAGIANFVNEIAQPPNEYSNLGSVRDISVNYFTLSNNICRFPF